MKRYGHLTERIVEPTNMGEAFDEVVGGLPAERRELYRKRRDGILATQVKEIGDGSFRVETFDEFLVRDGPKVRKVQSPSVTKRIGCNAIMRVVEDCLYPSVIRTSAAAIKGRGMHRLFRKVRSDIRHDVEGTRYYYKCDVRKFYESIDQAVMWGVVQKMVKDETLLPVLHNFVTMMPRGLSIGLRSSQCFGNLILSDVDHWMKEREGVRYYYRYCDDIVMLAPTKRQLWQWRDVLHREVGRLGLEIKPDEAVRPIGEGLDFLGYVFDGSRSRLRKRTKQRAARKLSRIKSRTRRTAVIGSFKGMAKWGDCGNLYYILTGRRMKTFKELGLRYVAEDGKKRFGGRQVSLRSLQNVHIKVVDYEKDVPTENGKRTVVSFEYDNGELGKYFTADRQQLWYLEKIHELGEMPFETVIGSEVFGNGKVRYLFT